MAMGAERQGLAVVEGGERPKRPDDLNEQFRAIVDRLQTMATERQTLRSGIEDRMIEDFRLYHGRYDDATLKRLAANEGSQLFVNQTRPKTNAVEAKLFDMLFPTDDKNWDIGPTPVPTLTDAARDVAKQVVQLKQQMAEQAKQQGGQPAPEAVRVLEEMQQRQQKLEAQMEEAKRRGKGMKAEIDDQLTEGRYPSVMRDVIHDGCLFGTGVSKGPVVNDRMRPRYAFDQQAQAFILSPTAQPESRPAFRKVDVWSFYPDMHARSMADSEGEFELHLLNKSEMRKLAQRPGFSAEAVKRAMAQPPGSGTANRFLIDIRSIIGSHNDVSLNRYEVWEYHGPLEFDEIRIIAEATGKDALLQDFADAEHDPLVEIKVTAWFCNGQLFYFGPFRLDTNESIYSVWNYEKDDTSIFGFGVPYLMRSPQSALNAGWRMMMDNAGLGAGPQIVIDQKTIEPADKSGDYTLRPRKVWLSKSAMGTNNDPFKQFNPAMHQAEMANIIAIAKQFIDDETGVPAIAQGEQGQGVTKTLGGMAILMNSTNVLFRRAVKNWDDDITEPQIRRIYHWNMQFSKREEIKGDLEVEARGTSVLLVREIESQNLMAIAMHFSAHPVLGPMIKAVPLLRRLLQTMMVPADEVVMTDEEIDEQAAKAKAEPPPPDPAVLKAQTDLEVAEMNREARLEQIQLEGDLKLQLAAIDRETAMLKLAAEGNFSMEEIAAKMQLKQIDVDSKERQMATEAAMTARMGPTGGGNF